MGRERRLGLLPPQMFWSFHISTAAAAKATTSSDQARSWHFPANGFHRHLTRAKKVAQVQKVRERKREDFGWTQEGAPGDVKSSKLV